METICLQCGNKGITNAFVYCVRCLDFAVHRYCLDVIPKTYDEYVPWYCGCKVKRKNKSVALKHDIIPCETGVHEVSERINLVSGVAKEKSNTVVVKIEPQVCEDSLQQLCDVSAEPDSIKHAESDESSHMKSRAMSEKHEEIKGQQPNSSKQREEENSDNLIKCASPSDEISLTETLNEKRSAIIEPSVEKDHIRLVKDVTDCTLPAKVKKSDDTPMKCASSSDDISLKEMVNKKRNVILEPRVEQDQNRLVKDVTDHTLPANGEKSRKRDLRSFSQGSLETPSDEISLTETLNKKRSAIIEPSVEKDHIRLVKDVTVCTLPAKVKKSDDTPMKCASSSDDISLKEMVNKKRNVILEPRVEQDQNRLVKDVTDRTLPANGEKSKKRDLRSFSQGSLGTPSDEISLTETLNEKRSAIIEPSVENDHNRLVKDVTDCTLPAKVKKSDDTPMKCASSSDDISLKEMVNKKRNVILEPRVEQDQNRLVKDVTDRTLPANGEKSKKRDLRSFSQGSFETETDRGTGEHPTVSCNGSSRSLKKMKTIVCSDANFEVQRQGTATAQILGENKGAGLEIQCFEVDTKGRGTGPSNDHYENKMIEFAEEKSGPHHVNNLLQQFHDNSTMVPSLDSHRHPKPIIRPAWEGSFNILHKKHDILNGLKAHLSTNACQKVYEEACMLQPVLHLEMLPKSDIWPKSFQTSEPSAQNIALYFFPATTSEEVFDRLIDKMMQEELGMRAVVQSAELLVFPSNELPLGYWMFQSKYYLWGVFRGKQSSSSHSQLTAGKLGDKIDIPADNLIGDKSLMATTKNTDSRSPKNPLSNRGSNKSDRHVVEHPIVSCNESFRSSKKMTTIMPSKANLEEQRHGTGSAQILNENLGVSSETQSFSLSTKGIGTGPRNHHYENKTREYRGESGPHRVSDLLKQIPNSSTKTPVLDSHRRPEPIAKPVWRGSVDKLNKKTESEKHPKHGKMKTFKTKKPIGKCFHCGIEGHWKRNCRKYLEVSKKKRRD